MGHTGTAVQASAGVNHTIGIVAHTARSDQAHALAETVGAAYLSMDDGTLGCEQNHRTVWQWMAEHTTTEWSVVLEDDAIPVDGFRHQLAQALDNAPTPIVSLYLGRKRPPHWQDAIQTAIDDANRSNANYITAHNLIHAVGVAIKTELVPSMTDYCAGTKHPWDYRIGAWAQEHQHPISYLHPSLVEHADGHTIAHHPDRSPRQPGRTAWAVGTRDTWTQKVTAMP